jgi:hypothetical protein
VSTPGSIDRSITGTGSANSNVRSAIMIQFPERR